MTDLLRPGELAERLNRADQDFSAGFADAMEEARALAQGADARIAVELETPEMTVNIGPQHPATHGVLRLVVTLEGELVRKVDIVPGYMHRGYEKLLEVRTYAQGTTLVNRIDWVSGFCNEIPFVIATERLMNVEATERANYIRVILMELTRIASHLMFYSAYPLELGAMTPMFLCFAERERVLDLIEGVTGGRFHPNFNRIGGTKDDFPAGWYAQCRVVLDQVEAYLARLSGLLEGNEIVLARTRGVGELTSDLALAYGVTGPNLRASGVALDLRKDAPYLVYDRFQFDVPIGTRGDSYDRMMVRLFEIYQSIRIVRQALDTIPAGPIQAKVPRIIKVPEGESYAESENPRGLMGYYVVSRGGRKPYRVAIRTGSFPNLQALSFLLLDVLVPDIIAILGSMDFVLGDIDR